MRIVFVTPHLPVPPNFGGARRMYELIRHTARRHDVTTLSLAGPDDNLEDGLAATDIGRLVPVRVSLTSRSAPSGSKRVAQLGSLVSPRSFQYRFFHHPQLQTALDQLVTGGVDLVQFEHSQMGSYRLPHGVPSVLDLHNIEHRLIAQHANHGSLPRRAFNLLEYRKFRGEEQAAWRAATCCIATSKPDAAEVERVIGRHVPIIANGVDTSYFRPQPLDETDPAALLFIGALRYRPNADAIRAFALAAMPLLRARLPHATLTVVGADPPPEVQALDHLPGIRVAGTVPDVRPWLAESGTVIVPLAVGGGTRLKILEAFAAGRPVVSTRLGAQGLTVEDGEHILLAERPEEFVNAVARLALDDALRGRLVANALQLVRRRYEWAAIADDLDAIYRELVAAARSVATTAS